MGNLLLLPNRSQKFTCEICFKPNLSPRKKFKNGNRCTHPFCTNCMINYVRDKLEQQNVSDINCPALYCDNSLDPLSMNMGGSSRRVFDKWCDLLCDSALQGLPRAYCPNRDCSAIIFDECGSAGNVGKSVCPKCKKLFCFRCNSPWHSGYGCNYRSSRVRTGSRDHQNDIALEVFARERKLKKCPRCHVYVERDGGGEFIDCWCGISFCYECGREVSARWCSCGGGEISAMRSFLWLLLDLVISTIILLLLVAPVVYICWKLL